MKPSLIVHGGAWEIPDESVERCRAGIGRALAVAWPSLQQGGSAADAVEAAIVVLEDDAVFDAGIGSHLNRDGKVELDAIMMDGKTLKAGAVAGVQRVRNPIRLARRVMEHSDHMMLAGAGAEQFAMEQGMKLCDPEELVTPAERAAWQRCREGHHDAGFHLGHSQGTVGAVALDVNGEIVAATSTGGTCCKLPGRVGDSPLIGCGCYADAVAGGISCTGYGEAIMKIVMAKTAADLLRPPDGGRPLSASDASLACVQILAERAKGTGGLILLDREGRAGFAFNTKRMAHGYVRDDGTFVIGV